MGYKVIKLQNQSNYPDNPPPTIVIDFTDEDWNNAFDNWLKGKNPTDSLEWKKGIFAITVKE